MSDEIKTWANTVGQQIEKMTVDAVSTTAANVSEASGDVFFVGRPAQNGQDWILKKITPTELEKMVYNYLTSNTIAPLLAQVLGGLLHINFMFLSVSGGGSAVLDTGAYSGFVFIWTMSKSTYAAIAYSYSTDISTIVNAGNLSFLKQANSKNITIQNDDSLGLDLRIFVIA